MKVSEATQVKIDKMWEEIGKVTEYNSTIASNLRHTYNSTIASNLRHTFEKILNFLDDEFGDTWKARAEEYAGVADAAKGKIIEYEKQIEELKEQLGASDCNGQHFAQIADEEKAKADEFRRKLGVMDSAKEQLISRIEYLESAELVDCQKDNLFVRLQIMADALLQAEQIFVPEYRRCAGDAIVRRAIEHIQQVLRDGYAVMP